MSDFSKDQELWLEGYARGLKDAYDIILTAVARRSAAQIEALASLEEAQL